MTQHAIDPWWVIWFANNWWWAIWVPAVIGGAWEAFTKGLAVLITVREEARIEAEAKRAKLERRRLRREEEEGRSRVELDAIVSNSPLGPCTHRRIAPVVGKDDKVVAWVCKNPDCQEQFPANYAVREEDL